MDYSMYTMPKNIMLHKRWIVCFYATRRHPWAFPWETGQPTSGWTMRHACGKFYPIDLTPISTYSSNLEEDVLRESARILYKIPALFGNFMKKVKRRHVANVCPRCKQKVPGGLIMWINTWRIRDNEN